MSQSTYYDAISTYAHIKWWLLVAIWRSKILRQKPVFASWRHQMTSYRQHIDWSWKYSSRPLIWGTTRYGTCDTKIWPWGQFYLTLGELLGVKSDRHQKLISWALGHTLYSHQVSSRSDKSYSKNKGFVETPKWPQIDLDLWPWPWFGHKTESIYNVSRVCTYM